MSRLIKRRSFAREMCDAGQVAVNGSEAKPAKDVTPGDSITLRFPSRIVELKVLDIPASSSQKSSPEKLYRIISDKHLPMQGDQWSKNLS